MSLEAPARPRGAGGWSFEQRLSWRIGTVLLTASLALLSVLAACRTLRVDAGVLGYGAFAVAWAPLVAALFSFAALVGSIVRRAPQCRFVVELAVELALAVAGTLLLGDLIVSGR